MVSNKTMTTNAKKRKKSDFPELLTITEASAILKCHPNSLRHWDNKGVLPAIRIGVKRIRRYRKEDIINFIKRKK